MKIKFGLRSKKNKQIDLTEKSTSYGFSEIVLFLHVNLHRQNHWVDVKLEIIKLIKIAERKARAFKSIDYFFLMI